MRRPRFGYRRRGLFLCGRQGGAYLGRGKSSTSPTGGIVSRSGLLTPPLLELPVYQISRFRKNRVDLLYGFRRRKQLPDSDLVVDIPHILEKVRKTRHMIPAVEGNTQHRHRIGLKHSPDCAAVKRKKIAVPGPGPFRKNHRTVSFRRHPGQHEKLPHGLSYIAFAAYEGVPLESELGGHKGDPVGEFLLGDKSQTLSVKRRN